MKIETYKCDVCGQMCNTTEEVLLRTLGYHGFVQVTIKVTDRNENELDVCKRCLLPALTKALVEDK